MKAKHIIFVHGLFGWGSSELGGIPYWGYALKLDSLGFHFHEASCGPVSSFHDRACEIAAQIKGTRINYGKAHSDKEHHEQYSDDYTDKPLFENWSKDNPVILVGHSAGAHTCLYLQKLLAEDYWGWGSDENWVEAIVSISGVLNGSTLPYMLGCDKKTGLLTGSIGTFLGNAIQIFAMAGGGSIDNIYDFDLDQWIKGGYGGDLKAITAALEKSQYAKGEDNLAFDLSLQGCLKANSYVQTYPNTYYLSIITEQTTQGWFTTSHFPDPLMNPALAVSAGYQGHIVQFKEPPIPHWGTGDLDLDKWRENDGAVSSISQLYPFTAGNHPVGGDIPFTNPATIAKGQWYCERAKTMTGRSFDHLDVGFGCFVDLTMVGAQKRLYNQLYGLLKNLP
jgi:triacylglycerol esterase/lipase EstA (alpha/beta hydrolase family)